MTMTNQNSRDNKSKSVIRLLSQEELRIWTSVTDTISKGTQIGKNFSEVSPIFATKKPRSAPNPKIVPNGENLQTTKMDPQVRTKIAKGRIQIDKTLDLHGMRLNEAYHALKQAIFSGYQRGYRILLVITGKGNSGTDISHGLQERGILRRTVPNWLDNADIKPYIIGYSAASGKHGGNGAIYLHLRRNTTAQPNFNR